MRRSMTMNPESELNAGKAYHETSVFIAENLLREARRQRGLGDQPVPDVCVLDPDGDIVRHLQARSRSHMQPAWRNAS